MRLNGYHLLLPEGTLDYFDLVDVKESMNEVIIYLEEKNQLPEKYAGQESEGFSFYAYNLASLYKKKALSLTPLNCALNALILALNDSAAALVALLSKKFIIFI